MAKFTKSYVRKVWKRARKRNYMGRRKKLNKTQKVQVKKLVNTTIHRELKWNYVVTNQFISPGANLSTTSVTINLPISQSLLDTGRIGNEIRVKGARIDTIIKWPIAYDDIQTGTVRVFLVRARRIASADEATSLSTFLGLYTGALPQNILREPPYDDLNVLSDKMYTIDRNRMQIRFTHKVKNFTVKYSANASTVVTQGNYYLICVYNCLAGGAPNNLTQYNNVYMSWYDS